MKPIIEYGFEDNAIRVVERGGEAWFVLSDICRALGIKNPSYVSERLDDDEKGIASNYTLGGDQNVIVISEGGLYTVILRSKAAVTPGTAAHRFRKWVTAELIPAVRRDGGYGQTKAYLREDAAKRRIPGLMQKIIRSTNAEERRVLHDMVSEDCRLIGIEPPQLDLLGRAAPDVADIVRPFFDALGELTRRGIAWNHSCRPTERWAINMGNVAKQFGAAHIPLKITPALKEALRLSSRPQFVDIKTVRSGVTGLSIYCWVFEALQG